MGGGSSAAQAGESQLALRGAPWFGVGALEGHFAVRVEERPLAPRGGAYGIGRGAPFGRLCFSVAPHVDQHLSSD